MNCKQVAVWDDAEGVSVLFYLCFFFFLKKTSDEKSGKQYKNPCLFSAVFLLECYVLSVWTQ